ncbi:cytochrome P450 CYP82D47-like [Benincasa hispida]|uniref:cytochrome P450 CYP82D47-like n=1 Tax=Benincasa hispida TaxID=102211 RepID=UPI001900D94D|nr:cytochrome P450 CYP82D47-like [Benincasa hispida]
MESPSKTALGMLISFLLFLYALFWVLSRRLLSNSQQRKKLHPPEVGGAWPVIGHLHLLGGSEPTYKILEKMADAYGPIFTLKMGSHRAVVVSNWEIAKECFTTNDRVFASRPKVVAAKHMGYDNTMFAFSQYGPLWRHIRKITTHEILSNHRLDLLQHIRRSEVQSSINKLHELWVVKGGEKVLVEMKNWFGELTLNIIFRMVVGKPFSTAYEGSGDDGAEGVQFQVALRDFLELFMAFVPSDSFPFLSWLDLGGYEKAMKKTAKVLDKTLDKWLREHEERRDYNNCGEGEHKEEDFMDVMLSRVRDVEELAGYDVGTLTKSTCLNLILGGADTTQVTMTWALSLLLNNEDTLKKAQLELDEQVGRERLVVESDVKNLLYLQAIVKETMRLYPAAPLAAFHEAMEDCNVSGYHIPRRTRLIVNLKKLQKDPLVWENPDKFQPERFLTTHKDFDVTGQSPQLIPFGRGRRMCPGVSFSNQVIHLTLANLLHGFEIGRPSQELINMEESVGITSMKTTPLEVVLTPRLSARVYL